MASNPYVNKVEFAGQTIMDISNDTVTPSDVLDGVTFHDRSGAPQTGAVITHNVYDGLDSTSTSDALSANQGKVLDYNTYLLERKALVYASDSSYTFSSEATLETLITTLAAAQDAYKERKYKISCTSAFGVFNSGYDYCTTIYRASSTTYINVEMSPIDNGLIKIVGKNRNGWAWEKLALMSDTFATHTVYLNNTDAIAANTVKHFDLNTAYTGYTPLGIVEITGSGTTGLVIQEYTIDRTNNIARIYYRNVTNAAVTPSQIKVTVLYINRIL